MTAHVSPVQVGMTNEQMALEYYRSGLEQKRPAFVPARVRLKRRVCGDFPFHTTAADPGQHECECNQWGAVSVRANDGSMLGVKPNEFEVTAWRSNEAPQS